MTGCEYSRPWDCIYSETEAAMAYQVRIEDGKEFWLYEKRSVGVFSAKR